MMSKTRDIVRKHPKRTAVGAVVVILLLIAVALLVYFLVIKKPYRGGKSSKGSTRLIFEAQTQKAPSSTNADSKTSTPTVDLKALTKTIQADMRKQLATKEVWVYSAAYPDALWAANNDASFKTGNVALYKDQVPKTCVSSYKDSTSTSFVVDGSAKTVTGSSTAPAWGLFIVETSATATAVSAAATKLASTGTINYGATAQAADNFDAAKTAVCTFKKSDAK